MAQNIRYSEAFKRQVVEQIAQGKFRSPHMAQKAYGIKGCGTIERWVRKYGRLDLLSKRIRIETMDELDELKEARKRIKTLEAALADAHVDYCLESAFFDIACERLGEAPEDFKKKHDMTLSEVRKRRGRR